MHLIHEQHVDIPSYPAFANRLHLSASTRRSALSDPPPGRVPLQADIINQTWLQQRDHGGPSPTSDPCHPSQQYPSPKSITSDLPPLLAPSTSVFGAPPHDVAASSRSSASSVVEQGPASDAGARDVKHSLSDGLTSPPPHKRTRTRSCSISSATSTVDTHRSVRSSSFGSSFSGTSASTGLSTSKCRESSASSRAISKAYDSRRYVAEALRAAIQSGRVNAATVSNDTVSRIVEGARKKAAKQGLAGKRAQGRSVGAGQDSGQPNEQAELRVGDRVKQVVRNAVSVEEDGEIEVSWDELSTLGHDGRKRRRANKTTTVMAVPV